MPTRQLFLATQQLSKFRGEHPDPIARLTAVLGKDLQKSDEKNLWRTIGRSSLLQRYLTAKSAPKRLAILCDAGLGKTTNLRWLEAAINDPKRRGQLLAFFLELPDLVRLQNSEHLLTDPKALSGHLWEKVAGSDPQRSRDFTFNSIERLRRAGRIVLLIDSLDQAGADPKGPAVQALKQFLTGSVWRECPIVLTGRPYAIEWARGELFDGADWEYLRVDRLAEAQIRPYLEHQAGFDFYDQVPASGRPLLGIPRLLHLICRIAAHSPEAVKELRTAADVYYLAYFHVDDASRDRPDRHGLIASGLFGEAANIGGLSADPANLEAKVERTAALVGAIAFELFDEEKKPKPGATPSPNLAGVSKTGWEKLVQPEIIKRLQDAAQQDKTAFDRDFPLLKQMNANLLDFLLLRDSGERGLVFADPTVQAFFAGYWATKFATPTQLHSLFRWQYDPANDASKPFYEFWGFTVEMPRKMFEIPSRRLGAPPSLDWTGWLGAVAPLYVDLDGNSQPTRSNEMLYRSWDRVHQIDRALIDKWRAPFVKLACNQDRDPDRQRVYHEIVDGFQDIPAGTCPFGASPMDNEPGRMIPVAAFRLHQYATTNEMYELYDARHQRSKYSSADRCPVTEVDWFDALMFARWCGCFLPTEEQWEYACRAGSKEDYCIDEDGRQITEATLREVARFHKKWNDGAQEVGQLRANRFRLYDMHGNVWEWCDSLAEAIDRVFRGGSWFNFGRICRSAYRGWFVPVRRYLYYGFRLAAVPEESSKSSSGADAQAERKRRAEPR